MRIQETADPRFVKRFLEALPPEVGASFTPDQLAGVQRCFGLRHGGAHPLDIRRSIWTPFGRMYLVLLAGQERRDGDRRMFDRMLHRSRGAIDVILSASVVMMLLMCLLGVLFALKLALGIDLVPGVDMLPDEGLIREMQR